MFPDMVPALHQMSLYVIRCHYMSSDVIICHQMSWKSDFNIHLFLVNRCSDPFPKSGKFPVRIFVKSSLSD
ncbi:hypothetical protein PARMER_04275 [Parabacteroides merdae ATCC 43184]|nr:hypothetical protein PARMER_04275 [Parabacteroides merdae ATCC 43184]